MQDGQSFRARPFHTKTFSYTRPFRTKTQLEVISYKDFVNQMVPEFVYTQTKYVQKHRLLWVTGAAVAAPIILKNKNK